VQLSTRYPGGAWLVELSPVVAGELVVSALAAALWARQEPGRTLLDSAVAVLSDRDALLIVDNCEHVLDAAAQLIADLLRACPRLRILATSQSRLGVSGEATWPVPPLAVPGPGDLGLAALAQVESVRLFCDRAALARPGFSLTGGNAQAVADICRRLDGLPLAIELAAARITALTPAQLAARLGDRFTLLTSGSRVGLPRHRTLAAAIEWSHDLLTPAEQVCLRRLAVFAGGCTLDAAEAVCHGDGLPGRAVFEAIAALVDRSLLTTEERSGSMRYRMLESIQVYARERLQASGEAAEMTGRHLAWLLDYAGRADLEGPDQSAWLDLLDADQDNFQAGLERSLAGGNTGAALALAGALAPYWAIRGQIQEGRRWLDAALSQAGAAGEGVGGGTAVGARDAAQRALAVAMAGAAQLASVHGDTGAQLRYLERSLELWRGLGDPAALARCLADLGSAAHVRGDYAGALARYTEALELARLSADSPVVARSLSGLGRLALHQGDHVRAVACYTESFDRFQQAGDVRQATLVLGNLGVISYLQGDLEQARARLEGHLGNARRLGDRKLIGGALTNLGMVDYDAGDLDRAHAAQREALALAEQIGDRRLAAVALTNLGLVALARGDHAGARSCHLRSLELAEAVGERRGIAESLEELAKVESAEGAADRAAVLFGAAQALRETIGSPAAGPDLTRLNGALAAVAATLGTRFGALQEAGRSLSMEDAISFARVRTAPRQPMTEPATPR
jgi:predicted ATPase/Tfp pilus assembly protein PilF